MRYESMSVKRNRKYKEKAKAKVVERERKRSVDQNDGKLAMNFSNVCKFARSYTSMHERRKD